MAAASGAGYRIAGETDDSSWAGATVQKIGSGGKADAFVGYFTRDATRLVVAGGSGDDRAIRMRSLDADYLSIAGETNSPDFPLSGGPQAAAGTDVWIGRANYDATSLAPLRLFGGSGDEQFGGMVPVTGHGILLAGTTNSTDLPKTTDPDRYHGGPSDGFFALLDPDFAAPVRTVYIGGSGRDEISAVALRSGDVYLGGSTDSPDLSLPGIDTGQDAAGGIDGLLVLADVFGFVTRGIRTGGAGDDRILSVEPWDLGKVVIGGWSESPEWFAKVDPVNTGSGGRDGFAASLTFAAVGTSFSGISPPANPYSRVIGQDLQAHMNVSAVSEPGMDGIVLVRSSDPSRLLVAPTQDVPGGEQVLLRDVDSTTKSVVLQALGDSGYVDVLIEGRSASGKNIYPVRRVRVRLAPTALFLSTPFPQLQPIQPGQSVTLDFYQAALLPDGSHGEAQQLRYGVTATMSMVVSDPDGLAPMTDTLREREAGRFSGSLLARNKGSYTVTPSSTRFRTAAGQSITVEVGDQQPRLFPGYLMLLPKDHIAGFTMSLSPGDSLVFTSDDPGRLRLGIDKTSALVTVVMSTSGTLWVAGTAADGIASVRVEGTYRGQRVSDRARFRLTNYRVSLALPLSFVVGTDASVSVSLTRVIPPYGDEHIEVITTTPWPLAFGDVRIESSAPAVLEVVQQGPDPLTVRLAPRQVGTATLIVQPGLHDELSGLTAAANVVPPQVSFGTNEIVVPAGASLSLVQRLNSSSSSWKQVRLRVSPNSPFEVGFLGPRGTDITADLTLYYAPQIFADNATPGQRATLFVSAPGVPEFQIPIRAAEPVLAPIAEQVTVTQAIEVNRESGSIFFQVAGLDNGRIVRPSLGTIQMAKPIPPVKVTFTPPGICEAVDSSSPVSSGIRLRCPGTGQVVLSLEAPPGFSSLQPQFTVRVISRALPVVPVLPSKVMTGGGVQTEFPLFQYIDSSFYRFTGTLTSLDPERVRLSLDPKAPGTSRIVSSTQRPVNSVYVQGYDTAGTATLLAETEDGRKIEVTVYLLPATLAVRGDPNSGCCNIDPAARSSVDQPLSMGQFTMQPRVFLVDPGSGKLISGGFSIRGGTDPAFVRARSSDPSVVEVVPPDALFSEGDSAGKINFLAKAAGDAVLSVAQPAGFTEVPESALRTRVFTRSLGLQSDVLISADLQISTFVYPTGPGQNGADNVTITSLEPQKLLLSTNDKVPGQASITAQVGRPFFLQGMSGVQPGERVSLRVESPLYQTTDLPVQFAAAALQYEYQGSTLELQPNAPGYLNLIYGPVRVDGGVVNNSGNSMRPGVNIPLRISSGDTGIVGVPQASVPLSPYMHIPLDIIRPGSLELRVEAPPEITNRAERVAVKVRPYDFYSLQPERSARYLVSRFTLTNPAKRPTTIAVRSNGQTPVRLGTAATGVGAPSSDSLTVSLEAGASKTLYLEPAGSGFNANIAQSAPDFTDQGSYIYFDEPYVRFEQGSALTVNLSAASVPLNVVLGSANTELPLGSAFGPLSVQVQSSNPQVVRAPAAPIRFSAGDSRKSITLELTGRGDAVVSLVVPAPFNTAETSRRNILISVK